MLKTAWTQPSRKGRKRVNPAIQRRLDELAADWLPPIRLAPDHLEAIRELLRRGPRRVGEAQTAGYAITLLVVWWHSDDRDFDLVRMLSPGWLFTFREVLAGEHYERGTLTAYIGALDHMGEVINPTQKQEWKALDSTPTSRPGYALPFNDDDIWALFMLAWAQPSARLRDGLLGLLYLTLGVGLYEGPVSRVRGSDVRRAETGTVVVLVDGRQLIVRPRYADDLLQLATRVGKRLLVPGASGKNKTSEFTKHLTIPQGNPKPAVDRLVATYRWWLDAALHLDQLVEQCGANVLVHLADIHRRLPRQPAASGTTVLAPADDVTDGPWTADWPAKHHRP